jgi:hypothetical protein
MTNQEFSRTAWRKSTHSGNGGGNCIEVADVTRHVAVRDSKNPDGPRLTFAREAWRAFSRDIQSGIYDREA